MKSQAFNITSWIALGAGVLSYLAGLWNLEAENAIKGYYFTVFAFGLYAAVSIQKTVRDKVEEIPVSNIYYGISWAAISLALLGTLFFLQLKYKVAAIIPLLLLPLEMTTSDNFL